MVGWSHIAGREVLERSPNELNRGRDSRIGFDLLVIWRFFDRHEITRPVCKGMWRAWRLISLLQRIRPRRRLLPAKMEIRALQSS